MKTDAEFEIISITARRRPLWVSAVIGAIRTVRGFLIMVVVVLFLSGVLDIATNGAFIGTIHKWLWRF